MRGIVLYFIKYPVAANLLMFAILIMGWFSLGSVKSTFFPEVESRIISIQIVYPGASPQEVEEGVISRIEENLKGLTGVERFTSVSRENSGTVTVEAFKGYNPDLVLQDVKNAVDRINSFPVGMEPAVIYKLENLGFAISFALSGEVDLQTLKRYGRQVEDELRAIDGISKVNITGFPDEEIEIAFRESDLRAYGLTFQQATQAVRSANLDITGGSIKGPEEELLVRARNKFYYADGLRDIVVKNTPNGGVVYLHQVANIRDQWADEPARSFMNSKPSVVATVQNTLEEDMIGITDKVKDYIEQFNAKNDIVKATIIRDGSVLLNQRIDLLTKNGLQGFFIVLLTLAIFLNWRLAFWVAIAIPVSFAGMFVCAYFVGITINVISLFGMIIVVGILVDDGIVIGESIYQDHEKGLPPIQAALNGSLKVIPAVVASVLTTVVAFGAFFFIEGRLGEFFSQMAVVVIASLMVSLIEGVLILPSHIAHSKALIKGEKPGRVQLFFDKIMNWLRDRIYSKVLKLAMHHKVLTFSTITGLLLITFGAIGGGIIKGTFFPIIERDDIAITLQMPSGTREHVTQDMLVHLEEAAWRANEKLSQHYFNDEKKAILRIERNIGPASYQGGLNVALLDGENRDSLSLREVINAIREEAGPMDEAELVTYGSQSAFGKPISISLVGNNYAELNAAAEKVKSELQELAELSDVVDNNQEGLQEVNLTLKDKALYLGLNLQDIVGQVRQGFFGSEVQRLQRGRDEVRVWVRYDEEDRSDLTQLANMRVRFSDGREFPLSEIANIELKRGVISINHIDGKREVKIEADVSRDDVSVSELTSSLRDEMLPKILAGFPSVAALFEGQNREQAKSAASIQIVGSVMLAIIFFIIALTFRSISQTVIVFLMIPFSMLGVGWGHWLMGAPISLFSFLGMVALIGVLVNDAIVFIDTYNDLLRDKRGQMEAIYEAGITRFRPILLTSVTTIAGLSPILLEKSLQAQFLIPMAISVSFGLAATTICILVLLPVLLIFNNRLKVYSAWLWNGAKPSYESVEPARKALEAEEEYTLKGGNND